VLRGDAHRARAARRPRRRRARGVRARRGGHPARARPAAEVGMRAVKLWLAAHLVAAIAGSSHHAAPPPPAGFPGWPAALEGRALTPLPLTAREAELARGFPGRVGRFGDGEAEVILRWVATPTRQLHPAADCLRGSGWSVEPGPLRVDARGHAWGTVRARRG